MTIFFAKFKVRENPIGNFPDMWRHISKGSWTFSVQDHGWQVSDCTAEGLKVIQHIYCKNNLELYIYTSIHFSS